MATNKYKTNIEPNLEVISAMAKVGVTEEDIAKKFSVAYSTFQGYKQKHEALRDALKWGAESANAIVAGRLFEKCTGFYREITKPIKIKHTEFDTERGRKLKEWEEIQYVAETVYYPPDVGAISFWLTNKDANSWSHKPERSITENGGGVVLLPEIEEN